MWKTFRRILVLVLISNCNARRKRRKEENSGERNHDIDRIVKAYENNDLYLMLGVSPTCSAEKLKDAYRQLSLSVHPDKTRDHRAETAFDMIRDAYELLSSPLDRAEYDKLRNERLLRKKQIAQERRMKIWRGIRRPFLLSSSALKQIWRYKFLAFLIWVLIKTLQA